MSVSDGKFDQGVTEKRMQKYWYLIPCALFAACLTIGMWPTARGEDMQRSAITTQPSTKPIWQSEINGTQTLIIIRHGEKPPPGLGQLTPRGLNRALAWSKLIPERFGRPDFLFAPDPREMIMDAGYSYSYLRPIATIEPLAIRLQMAVRTPFGHTHISELQQELLQANYANSTSVIVWEHLNAEKLARNILATFDSDAKPVPVWTDDDYDSAFVIKITRTRGRKPTLIFTHEKFPMPDLSDDMPEPARKN